jgi:hypothetical protein
MPIWQNFRHWRLTNGHFKLHPSLHQLDGRDRRVLRECLIALAQEGWRYGYQNGSASAKKSTFYPNMGSHNFARIIISYG